MLQTLSPKAHGILDLLTNDKTLQDLTKIDTLSLEETKQYSEKMGRWRRRAIEISGNAFFWKSMKIMHDVRAPLIHFSSFLKQKQSPSDDGKVAQMVNGKCHQIMDELWMVMVEQNQEQPADESDESLSMQELKDMFWIKSLSFNLACKYASQLHRRVVQKTESYPLRLFGLIKAAPDKYCAHRKCLTTELCSLYDSLNDQVNASDLDVVTKKIMSDPTFNQQVRDAAQTGELAHELHTFLRIIAKYIKVDVRENERINKLLSMLGEACPNASLVSWL